MKTLTILGTRPEIIRLSRVIEKLEKHTNHILVHTGQNFDYNLNEIFFSDLNIKKPDYFLDIKTNSVGQVYAETIAKSEQVLQKEKPDAVIILGDTNSSIAAIIAKRMKIPIYHLEAGNRCFDLNVPEEINRKIIDHIADFNIVYTEHGRRNLLNEGISARRVYLSGSPMREILEYYSVAIAKSTVLKNLSLQPKEYILVSAHREEVVDRRKELSSLISLLNTVSKKYNKKILVSTHPRTRKRIKSLNLKQISQDIIFHEPFGYFDYITLQTNAFCTLSDSGTVSEESAILGFPAITFRSALERPEAIDAGTIVLTGIHEDAILKAIDIVTSDIDENISMPLDYSVNNFSDRVLKLIIGTNKLSNAWSGINLNDLC